MKIPLNFLNWTVISNIKYKVLSSNPVHGEVYSIQHYVIKFVIDLRQVVGFLHRYNWNIVESGVKHYKSYPSSKTLNVAINLHYKLVCWYWQEMDNQSDGGVNEEDTRLSCSEIFWSILWKLLWWKTKLSCPVESKRAILLENFEKA